MAYTLSRIGKALVKYFKPVRIAKPHLPHETPGDVTNIAAGELADDLKSRFKLLKFKKPERDKFAESKTKAVSAEDNAHETALAQLPEKAPSQWLDLVIHLLTACKRASMKMSRGVGLQAYRHAMAQKTKGKFQTSGSIINTKAGSNAA